MAFVLVPLAASAGLRLAGGTTAISEEPASSLLPTQFFGPAVHTRLAEIPGVPAWEGDEAVASAGDDSSVATSRRLHLLPGLMSPDEVGTITAAADTFETAQDTVDHQATYLCRIIDEGAVLDEAAATALQPFLENQLLPYVRQRFGCATACVQNMLVRCYRPGERRRLEAHFDVSSYATAIVSLSPSHAYDGGLYVQRVPGVPSRRYVALEPGDCLVHQFDTMHGVHVPGGSRLSLVVWFSESADALRAGTAPWVERAAAAGNAEAMFVLGGFVYRGEFGHVADVRLATRWLSRSAALGNPLAMLHLGSMLASGEVASDDLPWLRAEHGAAATATEEPLTEPALAASLYARAAEQGHPTAEYALGLALLRGEGVARDRALGIRWLEKAASQGEEEVMAAGWAADELRGMRTRGELQGTEA